MLLLGACLTGDELMHPLWLFALYLSPLVLLLPEVAAEVTSSWIRLRQDGRTEKLSPLALNEMR